MDDSRFALVEFQGAQLLTGFDGETVRVAMKPLVEALGIGWASQYQKIMGDPVLSKGVTLSVIPSERGAQQTVTLPIDLMHGWLFKLNPEKVAPEARERVIAYQRECYQVLHDYWVKGAAINPRGAAQIEHSDRTTRRRELPGLLDRMEREAHPEKRRILHAMIVRACEAEGIEPPLPDAIAPAPDLAMIAAEAALARVDTLVRERPELNHHRSDYLIAVRGKDLQELGIHLGKSVKLALARHPRFVGNKGVNNPKNQNVHCWIFTRA